VPLCHLGRVFSERKVDFGCAVWRNRDGLAPDGRIGKNWALHAHLRHHIVERTFSDYPPALVPGHDIVLPRRYVGQFEIAVFVGDGVVRMLCDNHFAIHPDVACIATQIDHAFAGHGASDFLSLSDEGQVVIGASRHVNRMQYGIAALDGEIRLQRNYQDVRFVTAGLLIQESSLDGEFHRFSGSNVSQEHHGIGYAAAGGDQQSLHVTMLLAEWIANLGVFIDLPHGHARHRPLPFDGSFDGAAVLNGNDLVTGLCEARLNRENHRQ